jgi:hypothetical protein
MKIIEHIEIFNNRKKLHSAIGYRFPVEYEKLNYLTKISFTFRCKDHSASSYLFNHLHKILHALYICSMSYNLLLAKVQLSIYHYLSVVIILFSCIFCRVGFVFLYRRPDDPVQQIIVPHINTQF